MGRIIFGLLTISENCRLLLYIVISVKVVMVGVLMPCSTLLQHNRWKVKAQFQYEISYG
jgi:hypothetical protein